MTKAMAMTMGAALALAMARDLTMAEDTPTACIPELLVVRCLSLGA